MPPHRLALTALVLVAYVPALLAQDRPTPPLTQPHTPTRLAWLALEAQSISHSHIDQGFVLSVRPTGYDTLVIFVRYVPDVKRELMNIAIDAARSVIQILARNHGWEGWLRIKEDIALGEERRAQPPS